jgi:hypothetical protein
VRFQGVYSVGKKRWNLKAQELVIMGDGISIARSLTMSLELSFIPFSTEGW